MEDARDKSLARKAEIAPRATLSLAPWVQPSVKADVEYWAITTAGLLRHAV